MTRFPSWPDGERRCAALSVPETARDFEPSLTLTETADRLSGATMGRRDLRVPAAAVLVTDGMVAIGGERLRLRPHAVKQLHHLATRALGRRVRSADELRRGLAMRGAHIVVLRVECDDVRAAVSGSFVPIDDRDAIGGLARAAAAMGWKRDLQVRFIAESESGTTLRVTLRSSRLEVRAGDAFERGFQLENGEIGLRALSLTPLIWRSLCWNYSVGAGPSLRLRHMGAQNPIVRDLRLDLADVLDRARLLLSAWHASATFAAANELTASAKQLSLTARIAAERRAQRMIEAGLEVFA